MRDAMGVGLDGEPPSFAGAARESRSLSAQDSHPVSLRVAAIAGGTGGLGVCAVADIFSWRRWCR